MLTLYSYKNLAGWIVDVCVLLKSTVRSVTVSASTFSLTVALNCLSSCLYRIGPRMLVTTPVLSVSFSRNVQLTVLEPRTVV